MSAAAPKKAAPKKASVKKASSTGSSYEQMIKEAILAHPEEARSGIGRPTIKKYIHQKHPQTVSMPAASFNNLISKAITKGEEKKIFVLPKGPSGKVKLAPKVKEVVKKPVVKKPVVKKPAVKKATPAKKPATAKKVSSATKPKKTTTSKKPAAKQTVTKKAAAKK